MKIFFGAYNVWGWHWAFALLFAVVGLVGIQETVKAKKE